jgi:integrase/recombinase XerD
MNDLHDALNEYVTSRRSLGFTLRLPASLLRSLVAFVERSGSPYITTELALQWATQPTGVQPSTWAWRLGIARRFAAWRRATDARTEVPPDGLLPHRYRRKPPHLYGDRDIDRLVQTAGALPSSKGLRGRTYATLFGLLAATGMRVSEALHLDRADVDLDQGVLVIRRTKFGKSRLVPVHRSTQDALRAYADTRDRIVPRLVTPAFFVSERGTRISECSARYTFAGVSRVIGLRSATDSHRHGHGPRLHDMRHRFAARTLIDWYRAGVDVEREIPKLAMYLGHVHTQDTYWYLEAVPELLQLAAERLMTPRPEVVP